MKFSALLFIVFSFLYSTSLSANFSGRPDLVETSATYAKLRAKVRATKADIYDQGSEAVTDDTVIIEDYFPDSGSCDLNVGNVLIDDSVPNPPDEVVIFIEGDILQANNCH